MFNEYILSPGAADEDSDTYSDIELNMDFTIVCPALVQIAEIFVSQP